MSETNKKCSICYMNIDDPVELGDFMSKSTLTVHYYCLLLSKNLPQRGKDTEGILGFLVRDIRILIKESSKTFCMYCGRNGASIACLTCGKYFHFKCGNEMDCVSEFVGEFNSYCHEHHQLERRKIQRLAPIGENCNICWNRMHEYNPVTSIRARCCGNGYVHRYCMRDYALSAGYYLVCIWCRKPDFRDMIRYQGVFVPDREANWEREKNAFSDLHIRHSRCDALTCLCPRGRDYKTGKWKIIRCALCGSSGIHNPKCIPGGKQTELTEYKCPTCSDIFNRTTTQANASILQEIIIANSINHSLFVSKSYIPDNHLDSMRQVENSAVFSPENSQDFQDNLEKPSAVGQVDLLIDDTPAKHSSCQSNQTDDGKVTAFSPLDYVYEEVVILSSCGEPIRCGKARINLNDSRFAGKPLDCIDDSEFTMGDIIDINNEIPLQDLIRSTVQNYMQEKKEEAAAKAVVVLSSDEEEEMTSSQLLSKL